MRSVTFTAADGSVVELEVKPEFESMIRRDAGLAPGDAVSDADVKRFFLRSIAKAAE